jgi:hypothetical protein
MSKDVQKPENRNGAMKTGRIRWFCGPSSPAPAPGAEGVDVTTALRSRRASERASAGRGGSIGLLFFYSAC